MPRTPPLTPAFHTLALPAPASLPPLSRALVALALTLARWEDRRRTRAALSRLDAHLLRDTGLTPLVRDAECLKPFWRD